MISKALIGPRNLLPRQRSRAWQWHQVLRHSSSGNATMPPFLHKTSIGQDAWLFTGVLNSQGALLVLSTMYTPESCYLPAILPYRLGLGVGINDCCATGYPEELNAFRFQFPALGWNSARLGRSRSSIRPPTTSSAIPAVVREAQRTSCRHPLAVKWFRLPAPIPSLLIVSREPTTSHRSADVGRPTTLL